jgi:hypothetical protein
VAAGLGSLFKKRFNQSQDKSWFWIYRFVV